MSASGFQSRVCAYTGTHAHTCTQKCALKSSEMGERARDLPPKPNALSSILRSRCGRRGLTENVLCLPQAPAVTPPRNNKVKVRKFENTYFKQRFKSVKPK